MRTRLATLAVVGLAASAGIAAPTSASHLPTTANAGCGDDGLTASPNRPTVRLTTATVRMRDTRARIFLVGDQTAAMTVKIAQVGGKTVGGTPHGSYTCATRGPGVVSTSLNAYGRALVRRHGRLAVKLTFRLINGSGVRHTRVWSAVIRPE